MMLDALPLLPLSVGSLLRDDGSPLGSVLAMVSLLVYGTGAFDQRPYLALVHDSAPYERARAGHDHHQFMLIISFAFMPVIFTHLMPSSTRALLLTA